MFVFTISPLTDARWDELVSRHRRAGVFHTTGWLSSLQRSYGYEPIAFTTCAPGALLRNALVLCKVKSWITGRRLVSLPFSDHCDVLADSAAEQEELLTEVSHFVASEGYAHAEIRPRILDDSACLSAARLQRSETLCLHRLSLEAPLHVLHHSLHRNCIQRKIERAEKEHLVYEKGRSESLLAKFYDLLLRTRRRHGLPPQPLHWFRNLVASMGDNLTIRLVAKDDRPVASMLTLSHKTTVIFKYGCSDERLHNLGGIPFLFWKTIQESKNQGMRELDLGRSEFSQPGLIQFKDRLGAEKTTLSYWRYPGTGAIDSATATLRTRIAKQMFSCMPDAVLAASGRLLYRHIG